MSIYKTHPADPKADFTRMAEIFSSLESEPTSEVGLKDFYSKNADRINAMVTKDEQDRFCGFVWLAKDKVSPDIGHLTLFVEPSLRHQGVGSELFGRILEATSTAEVKRIRVEVPDDCVEGMEFARRRDFKEISHRIAMGLDLKTFDDSLWDVFIKKLQAEGTQFTNMKDLGNTEEMQRKLFELNDTTDTETMGADGAHAWSSFEDFQQRVCQSDWYMPEGQIIAIDTTTETWAAMSAITRMQGVDYAYNLFTGVDKRYRGRKLGQAVKVYALRFAREVLKVNEVRTDHNSKNLPMLAIDRKFGYYQLPGSFLYEKVLN